MLDQTEIHRKAVSDEVKERREAVEQLEYDFVDLHDKEQAWEDLYRLTRDEDSSVRWLSAHQTVTKIEHGKIYTGLYRTKVAMCKAVQHLQLVQHSVQFLIVTKIKHGKT